MPLPCFDPLLSQFRLLGWLNHLNLFNKPAHITESVITSVIIPKLEVSSIAFLQFYFNGGVAVGRQANWPTGNWPTKLVDKDNWPTVNWSTKLADKNIF